MSDRKERDLPDPQARAVMIWIGAAADVVIGFLLALFGPAWFGLTPMIALVLGLAVVGLSIGVALWMTSRSEKTG